jgi:hypothetical protein
LGVVGGCESGYNRQVRFIEQVLIGPIANKARLSNVGRYEEAERSGEKEYSNSFHILI